MRMSPLMIRFLKAGKPGVMMSIYNSAEASIQPDVVLKYVTTA
jgi:hypothetical protein